VYTIIPNKNTKSLETKRSEPPKINGVTLSHEVYFCISALKRFSFCPSVPTPQCPNALFTTQEGEGAKIYAHVHQAFLSPEELRGF